jgi:AcrR family transcriptional regulator
MLAMTRLSRADSQVRTREQLVATAKTLFLRDGYFATSLDRVAEEAGYSKGAVYSNFRGKDELGLAVLDEIRAEQAGQIVAVMSRGSDLELEFGSTVRRNRDLRAAYTTRGSAIRAALAQVLVGLSGELGTQLPMAAEELATAFVSLGIGLGLQRAVDHDLPVRVLTDLVRVLAGLPPVGTAGTAGTAATAGLRSAPAGRARS